MKKIDKMIEGLKHCKGTNNYNCRFCPYGGVADCLALLHQDMLDWLTFFTEEIKDEGNTLV